jgi:transposase-like protein
MTPRHKRTDNSEQKKVPAGADLRQAIWESIEGVVAALMKVMFEILLDRAATEQIEAGPYERSARRQTYRNGTYKRRLST